MKQLNIQDAGFIYQETEFTPMHISGLGLYDQGASPRPRLNLADTVGYIRDRIHNCPVLAQKLFHVPGQWERPYWVEDPDFDVARHITHHQLPEPGNEQQLHQLVSRLVSTQLDMAKPLWECHLIDGLDDVEGMGKGSFAILTKVHHSCIDGAAGTNVLTVLHDLAPFGEPTPKPDAQPASGQRPGKYELMARAYASNLWGVYEQTAKVMAKAPLYAKVAADLYRGKMESGAKLTVPPTRFNKTPSNKRVFTSVDLPLEAIKLVKNVHGTTVNDVMVAVIAGALRNYLQELHELPEESLGAMLPKNLRNEASSQDRQGNQVGGLVVDLHTDIADPVERLKAVQASALKAKAFSEQANTDQLFQYLMGGFLYPRAGKALAQWAQKHGFMEKIGPLLFNTIITNVAGPNFPLYHAGAPMKVFSGVPPLPDGMGLAHAVYSYCGRINIAVMSCPLMLEDAEFYAQCIRDSFNELHQVSLLIAGVQPEEKKPSVKAKAAPKKKASGRVGKA